MTPDNNIPYKMLPESENTSVNMIMNATNNMIYSLDHVNQNNKLLPF